MPPRAAIEARARGLRAIVISASAGGVPVLQRLLPALQPALGATVLVVLHVAPGTGPDWSLVFRASSLAIQEAEDRAPALPARVYMAPPGRHLLVEADGTMTLSLDPKVNLARPSIDVLFESAAWAYGRRVLGVILTGANADGARGLAVIDRAGGLCWVQAPGQAFMATMPRMALAAVPRARVLTLDEMADTFRRL